VERGACRGDHLGRPTVTQKRGQATDASHMTRGNVLYLVIGALTVAVVVLAFELYQAKQQPAGAHINLGEKGLSIESK